MKVLFTDHDMLDVSLEQRIFEDAGIELRIAQCRTEDDVIREGKGCSAMLVQYAPINAKVFEALPELRLCARIGAGYDTINAGDAARHGVWVANSPDYGVGEVSLHALSMMLALIRNIVRYDNDIHAGTWHYSSPGTIPRAQDMTVGILGLGRIGKRFAHYAQPIFKRVIAHDPNLIDGDFPQYVAEGRPRGTVRDRRCDQRCTACSTTAPAAWSASACSARMKPGAYLVNTARGAVVDIEALVRRGAAGPAGRRRPRRPAAGAHRTRTIRCSPTRG